MLLVELIIKELILGLLQEQMLLNLMKTRFKIEILIINLLSMFMQLARSDLLPVELVLVVLNHHSRKVPYTAKTFRRVGGISN